MGGALEAIRAGGLLLVAALCGCQSPGAEQTEKYQVNGVEPGQERGRITLGRSDRTSIVLPGGEQRNLASLLRISRPLRYGEFRWDEAGIPSAPVWVRVDLAAQTLSVFRGEHEIGTGVILYGADGYPTPRGRFPILAKLKDHRSSTYDAEMPYTLRLTRDGVAIHGSNVRQGAATHGCVGIPERFAAHIFAVVQTGDPVFIVSPPGRPA